MEHFQVETGEMVIFKYLRELRRRKSGYTLRFEASQASQVAFRVDLMWYSPSFGEVQVFALVAILANLICSNRWQW